MLNRVKTVAVEWIGAFLVFAVPALYWACFEVCKAS